jgi:hypothetical protein
LNRHLESLENPYETVHAEGGDEASACDTPGVSFMLCREICPNLGRSMKFSISRSRLSPFIKLFVKVSPISDFTRLQKAKFGAC